MYLFYVLSAFLVIAGYLTNHGENRADATLKASLRTQATHMWTFHQAAREYCSVSGATCDTARVLNINDIRPHLPVMTVSAGRLTSGQFVAFTDGTGNVVTIHHGLEAGMDQMLRMHRNVVGNSLKEIVPDYVYAGNYNRSAQRVYNLRGQSQFLTRNPVRGGLYDEIPLILTNY